MKKSPEGDFFVLNQVDLINSFILYIIFAELRANITI